MKKINILFSALLFPVLLFSVTPDKVLKDVEKKMKSEKSIHIHFDQTYVWEMTGETSEIEGELKLKGEDRFCISTPGQEIVSNGKTLWTYNVDADRVLVDEVSKSQDALLPKQLLFHYRENYTQTMAPDEKVNGHDCYVIVFESLTGDEYFPIIRGWIDKKAGIPRKIEQTDLNKNRSVYTFKTINFNTDFPDDVFEFIPAASTEVIEL